MFAPIQVLRYIVNNNPWYQVPARLVQGLIYQIYKRFTCGICTKTLFNGKKIFLFPHNPISSAFVYTAIPDKNEILTLRQFADANTIFLDVGANVGTYSILLSDIVKEVYAFEAHPVTADGCKLNFLLNGIDAQQVYTQAVSNNSEPKFFSNGGHGCPTNAMTVAGENTLQVQSITLDQFVQQQSFPAETNFLLKIDVEGFEHEVFQGAQELLSRFPVRAIIFETFSSKQQEIMTLLHKLGYQTRPLGNNNMLAFRGGCKDEN